MLYVKDGTVKLLSSDLARQQPSFRTFSEDLRFLHHCLLAFNGSLRFLLLLFPLKQFPKDHFCGTHFT